MTRTDKANEIARDLKTKTDKFGNSKFPQARVWVGHTHVRVYTGHGNEYLTITEDGSVEKSRLNMTWGQNMRLLSD